ncbi:alpha/beta fold hydrolase [Oceanobacter mangrovi]|uniref:alpha/beta fold hydrolase n=1 Tax=Oceanobacter mangrovi TaxID=2862510 RepID=UPI001C8CFBC6|nr:alpha/beta hydrolase [Oceanobacter mangrovi]
MHSRTPQPISIEKADGQAFTAWLYQPHNMPARSLIQILHGMAEHRGRYESFIETLVNQGHAVVIHNHSGHGEHLPHGYLPRFARAGIAVPDGQPGKPGSGWWNLVEDAWLVQQQAQARLPVSCPNLLFGHSMGSWLALCVALRSPDLQGLILSGSSLQSGWLYRLGGAVAGVIGHLIRYDQPSRLLSSLAFGNYNAHIDNAWSNWNWLSRCDQQVTDYLNDGNCGFDCSPAFWQCLFHGLSYLATETPLKDLRPELPILLVSGDEDPVSDYGQSLRTLELALLRSGHDNTTTLLYPGARHELLHETNAEEVINDISHWLDLQLRGSSRQAGQQPVTRTRPAASGHASRPA